MTGYMYNPSKKVSEILSQYLEFDPEQLSLGIWSGNLTLHDVSLREDAVYPILNRHLNSSESSGGTRAVAASSKLDYCPPPARFKLVSGSIGSLGMKIPWTRLVWGPGDVEVKLRNVVLVVALESVEETEQRMSSKKDGNGPNSVSGGNNSSEQCCQRQPWDFPGVSHHDDDGETDSHAHSRGGDRSSNPELVRELHQTRLREAEKRLLEGRWNASWMDGVRKKDQERIATLVKERESSDTERHANSWLASATKDFFWRFCAGLVLDVENLKVILVQDAVELGMMMPSVRLANASPKTGAVAPPAPTQFEGSDASTFGIESAAGHEDVIYKGVDSDEGEQIDKTIRILGLGLFIRRKDFSQSTDGAKPYRFAPDATTKEFIVRPVDCSFEYSFFYPTPPDKRKRKDNHSRKDSHDQTATTVVSGDGSSAGSSKRRRGKRDKISSPEIAPVSSSAALNSPTAQPKIGFDLSTTNFPKPTLNASLRQRRASTVGSSFAPNSRRQSIAFRPTPQRPPSALRSSTTAASAPLVQPDNIAGAYASAAAANHRDTIRLESKMTVGAVEVIVSSSHYGLFMDLLCSCARTRNGRPIVTIQSEIDEVGKAAARSLLVPATSRHSGAAAGQRASLVSSSVTKGKKAGDPELRLQLHGFRSRRDALRKWWLYATRLIVWELRERKRLRLTFQKRFLFFSWKTQKYRRREYVSLFISVHLSKSVPSDDTQPLEELLAIEDELTVEQILLYRSIARAVFVRGKRGMPESILEICDNAAAHVHEHESAEVDRGDNVQKPVKRSREAPSFLSMLEKQGELARVRVHAEDHEHLVPYDPFQIPSATADNRLSSVVYDDSTYAHTVDTRAVRNQRRRALNLSDIDGVQEKRALFVSFSFSLDKVEVVVVDDSNARYPSAEGAYNADDGSDSASSFESNVSVLTDDQRFFKESGETDRSPIESEVSADPPVLSSTDFLIFNAPENILLRVSISPILLSLLARSGGSRNANVKIGRIVAFGDDKRRFLHVGRANKPAPLAEVGMGTSLPSSSGNDWGQEAPSSALSLSLIVNNSSSIVECDASTICVTADAETFVKVDGFRRGTFIFPKRMLSKSLQEEARLHLLKQAGHRWRNVNSSVRVHGFELALPTKEKAFEDDTNSTEDDEKPNVALRLTLLEVYSGTAVTALGEAADDVHVSLSLSGGQLLQKPGPVRLTNTTRTLRMIDVTERTANRPSIRANNWVVSASGIDLVMNFSPPMYYAWSKQSFLENPFDLELMWTSNEGSLGDFNRPKSEFAVRCSPVDFVASRGRVERLFNVVPQLSFRSRKEGVRAPLPTRLEVLSQFMLHTVDFRVQRLRLSLDNEREQSEVNSSRSKQMIVRDILSSFLVVIASFDLSYPNEEALASAMQISIDRLTGQGLSLNDSWEVTNAALLNFMEVCSSDDYDDNGICSSVESTVLSCASLIRPLDELLESDQLNYSFVLDLPEGFSLSTARLFYDSCVTACVPIVFITDSGGIHILRVAPPDCDDPNGENDDSKSALSDASAVLRDGGLNADQTFFGFSLRGFQLDQLYPFGRGGEPLTALSSDSVGGVYGRRKRESIFDAEVAEVEVTFCRPVYEELLKSLSRVFEPLNNSNSVCDTPNDDVATDLADGNRVYVLASISSSSFQFLTDGFAPFCRLLMRDEMFRKVISRQEPGDNDVVYCAGDLSLMNLTREGELYPDVFLRLSESTASPLRVRIAEDVVSVQLQGVRLVILQQFISELQQYFVSGRYGVGSFVASVRNAKRKRRETSGTARSFVIEVLDSSLLLPRCTTSPDLVAVEVDAGTIRSSRQVSSFDMPSNSTPVRLNAVPETDPTKQVPYTRLTIELHHFRLFTALPLSLVDLDEAGSLSFRFFHEIDGRAEAGKHVFCRRVAFPGNRRAGDVPLPGVVKRVWAEITRSSSSLDVIIDRAPHLRILVADPFDAPASSIELDMSTSQFALLLSIWYSNMQQLPVTFPLAAVQLEATARALSSYSDFPEYGSAEFTALLLKPKALTTEICVLLGRLSLRCSIDHNVSDNQHVATDALRLQSCDITVHVTNDAMGVSRIGSGASYLSLVDETKTFDRVIQAGNRDDRQHSWADLRFGLSDTFNLSNVRSQAFQMSVFMTPGWSAYNLGVDRGEVAMSEFSSIFSLLDFITRFAKDPNLGSPSFQAAEHSRALKTELQKVLGINDADFAPWPASNSLDFRLWLHCPKFFIPCNPFDASSSGVLLEGEGFRYRYTALNSFASHEVASRGLDLHFVDTFCLSPGATSRQLIDGLTCRFRLDFNERSKHTDVTFLTTLAEEFFGSAVTERPDIKPTILDRATICRPFRQPARMLGPLVCEMTVIIELLPLVWRTLSSLFAQVDDVEEYSVASSGAVDVDDEKSTDSERTFSLVMRLKDCRVFSCDPILGPHLPVAVFSAGRLDVSASQFALSSKKSDIGASARSRSLENLHIIVRGHVWADYFKLGLTRSWEPLLEAYKFEALYEKSHERGFGLSIASDSPFHVNVSGALLVILDEVIDSYRRSVAETMGETKAVLTPSVSRGQNPDVRRSAEDSSGEFVVLHERPRGLAIAERVPFAVKNMTGQELRLCKPADAFRPQRSVGATVVSYVDHGQSVQLNFLPSISVVSNMHIVDVEFPGLPNGRRAFKDPNGVPPHAVDIQLPGFHWIQGVEVDTFGRSFADMTPSSQTVFDKSRRDWRIANVMKLLVEVGLQNGGRQVTIRSLFSITNRTTHKVCLCFHPDPAYVPRALEPLDSPERYQVDGELDPGELLQVPVLLTESALRQSGSHLGCIWIRPSSGTDSSSFKAFLDDSTSATSLRVEYSSKPIQLARLVSDSALLFENQLKNEVANYETMTGVDLSCSTTHDSERLAPFCYVVEVARSPLARAPTSTEDSEIPRNRDRVHGPVVYSLTVHPTFVVVNLLPQKGRFELMHAVRKTVLWFADLDAGEEFAIHSVGLDAPLLLSINIGYCKTPVGEGALVHHGVDPPRGARDAIGLKSIGKAGKAVTKQIGKTLTKIGESPDKRGHERLFLVQNPQFFNRDRQGQDQAAKAYLNPGLGLNNDEFASTEAVGGKTFRTDTAVFFPTDVVAETTVVDGIGQRLTVNIENVRGGGGQRRISVYSPFWIVNSTEHSLRYRQEKGNTSFVCGTVSSPERDGSRPLEGGRAELNYGFPRRRELETTGAVCRRTETIFSGMPGALASSPGTCDLPPNEVVALVDANLALNELAKLAFMFNFSEGVLSLGNQKLCVQLWDGTGATPYSSDWSQGLSLDSVGFSQVIGMHCKDGRTLELTAIVSVAPGLLSGYTKVVRIVSRFFVVNSLPYPVRLWQDSSVFRPPGADGARQTSSRRTWRLARQNSRKARREVNQYETLWGRETVIDERSKGPIPGGSRAHPSALYITSLRQAEIAPFTLPDSRGERQLRLDVGGYWNLTASVSADVPGEHTVKLTRAFDLKLAPHVSTRGSPEYIVKMSPAHVRRYSCELGIWFETDWGNDKKVIVKAVKKESFAFQETDVHVGDELLSIDGDPVSRLSFNDAMTRLRTRLTALSDNAKSFEQGSGRQLRRSSLRLVGMGRGDRSASFGADTGAPPLVLRFRTVEERLRRVRAKAARASDVNVSEATGFLDGDRDADSQRAAADHEPRFVKIDLRSVQHSYFLVLKEQEAIPYKIQNRSRRSTIYYRQKGCDGHPWQCLGPGNSSAYTWEEPLRAKRLSVRVSLEKLPVHDDDSSSDDCTDDSTPMHRNAGRSAAWRSFLRQVKDEEDSTFSPIVNIRLEEIGFKDILPFHAVREGDEASNARYLELEVEVQGISRVLVVNDASTEDSTESLMRELECLKTTRDAELLRLQALRDLKIKSEMSDDEDAYDGTSVLMGNFPGSAVITARHQILVEVIEANGLSTDTFAGSCNPYAEVYMKCSNASRLAWRKKRDRRKTYYITNTVSPSWKGQVFVFDVSPQAVYATRGYSIKICLRDYRPIGQHKLLGAAQVELHSLRDQNALVGWFPLAGRTGRHELENQLSYWGRGSVKLKLQWIYSPPAYLDYCILLSERRAIDLEECSEQISQHLHQMQAAEARRRDELDGFQKVRIHDIVSRSSKPRKPTQHHAPVTASTLQPASTPLGDRNLKSRSLAFSQAGEKAKVAVDDLTLVVRAADFGKSPVRKTTTLKAKVLAIEALMNKTRQTVSTRDLTEPTAPAFARRGFNGTFSVTSFHSWPAAHVVFRDPDLSAMVVGEEVKVRISEALMDRQALSRQKTPLETPQGVARIFQVPKTAPSALTRSLNAYASSFSDSREAFEFAVERKMKTVIHPGGWLVVRPLTALNLSDAYTGMFVKLRYGAEVVVSETVDARVNPSWDFTRTPRMADSDTSQRGRRGEGLANPAVHPNDLHVRVPPQKTSGAMILSVVGERRTAKIQSVKELGVLHLPLGAAIAACIDGTESHEINRRVQCDATATYLRWFPLMSPGDVTPVEGDYGLSFRPLESEKLSDTEFHEYFAPCIQLALLWIPDSDERTQEDFSDGASSRLDSPTTNTSSNGAANGTTPSIAPAVIHYVVADISRISAALIDSQRSIELISISASDIEFRFWATKAKTRVGVAIGWLQVDQQHDDAREPVILAPTPSDFIGPVIQVLAVQDNSRSKTEILTFDFIDLSLEEFDLTLEEKILFDLFDFIRSVKLRKGLLVRRLQHPHEDVDTSQTQQSLMKSNDASNQPPLSDLLFSCDHGRTYERKVYIEQLFLGVVKVNLSYLKGKRQSWELTSGGWVDKGVEGDTPYKVGLVDLTRGERLFGNLSLLFHERSDSMMRWSLLTSDDDLDDGAIGKNSQSFPELFAALFPNISDAPIRLQGKALNHVLESPNEILQSVQKYYVNETLRQVYRIIGSLDFVGNPTMLFTSFVSGVRDLVVTPSKAFMKSPTDASGVGLGVAQGTLSLFSHSTSGFFGFCAKVSAAAGQGLSWLTLDPDYRNWHRDHIVVEATNLNRVWKRRGIQSLRATVARPVLDIFIGVGGAVTGIFILPYKGYVRGGGRGLLLGVAGAATGIIVKPIIGVLDAMAHFGATIHDIAKSVNVLDRRRQPALRLRLPYTFGIMQILSPFNQDAARAVRLLRQFPIRGLRLSSLAAPETLVHVEVLQNVAADTYIIVSSFRILLVRLRRESTGGLSPSLGWEVSLAEKSNVTSRMSQHGHSGFGLTVTVSKPVEDDPAQIKAVHFDAAEDIESQGMTFDVSSDPDHSDVLSDKFERRATLQAQLDLEARFEGQYQGTARGDEGELVEWFSVLAEYQHRPQLARIHNVVACLTANFSSIINDPSLGRPWSSEGYTSFGMFYFHQSRVDWKLHDLETHHELVEMLEVLPWVDPLTLDEASTLDTDAQKVFLNDFRKRAASPQETLEVSRRLGGPDWLVAARAEGCRAASQAETAPGRVSAVTFDEPQRSTDRTATPRPSRIRRWASTPLATIPDGRILETLNFRSPFRRDLGDRNRSDETSQERTDTENETASMVHQDESSDGSNIDGEDLDPVSSSFMTAAESFSGPGRALDNRRSMSASRLDSFHTAPESLRSSAVSTASTGVDAYDEVAVIDESLLRSQPPSDWATTEYEVRTRYRRQSSGPLSRDEGRMDRMERLLEGLLIFASEQALMQQQQQQSPRRAAPARANEGPEGDHPDGTHALWDEIVRLRSELHERLPVAVRSREEAALFQPSAARDEVAQLRTEIADLRRLLLSEAGAGVTGPGQSRPPAASAERAAPSALSPGVSPTSSRPSRLSSSPSRESDSSLFGYSSARFELEPSDVEDDDAFPTEELANPEPQEDHRAASPLRPRAPPPPPPPPDQASHGRTGGDGGGDGGAGGIAGAAALTGGAAGLANHANLEARHRVSRARHFLRRRGDRRDDR